MRLLVTRPQPDAERTAAELRARGHEVLVAPLLRFEPIACEWGPGPFAAIIVTSANALRALADHPRRSDLLGTPVIAVGEHTADAARKLGFADIRTAGGDVHSLAAFIAGHAGGLSGPLLYLAGEERTADLARALGPRGVSVETVEIYRMRADSALAPDIVARFAAGEIDGVLHFSRRTAQAFVDAAGAAKLGHKALTCLHYCLSEAVASVLIEAGARRVRLAERPDHASLLALTVAA